MPGTKLQEHSGSDKAWVWSAVDFAEGEQKIELFAIRFGSVDSECGAYGMVGLRGHGTAAPREGCFVPPSGTAARCATLGAMPPPLAGPEGCTWRASVALLGAGHSTEMAYLHGARPLHG